LPYNRQQAVGYAASWWSGANPMFRFMRANDCTNFVSQCLWAGGMPMAVTNRRDKGWWYLGPNEQWSYPWAVSNSLRWYLDTSGRGQQRGAARDLELGDVISYDWHGGDGWDHTTIVVGFAGDREPLVAAHAAPAWERPWRYADSPSYSPRTKYLFWHIAIP
jgi:hypothetical protein